MHLLLGLQISRLHGAHRSSAETFSRFVILNQGGSGLPEGSRVKSEWS